MEEGRNSGGDSQRWSCQISSRNRRAIDKVMNSVTENYQ